MLFDNIETVGTPTFRDVSSVNVPWLSLPTAHDDRPGPPRELLKLTNARNAPTATTRRRTSGRCSRARA